MIECHLSVMSQQTTTATNRASVMHAVIHAWYISGLISHSVYIAIADSGPRGPRYIGAVLSVTPMLSTKFRVNWHFSSVEEAKNRWRPSWISNQNNFFYLFLIYKSPQSFLLRFQSIGLSVQEKKRKNSGHLGFLIRTILAIFYLQVTPMLPTSRVNWPFALGEKAKKKFSRWSPWQPSWISNREDFSYF